MGTRNIFAKTYFWIAILIVITLTLMPPIGKAALIETDVKVKSQWKQLPIPDTGEWWFYIKPRAKCVVDVRHISVMITGTYWQTVHTGFTKTISKSTLITFPDNVLSKIKAGIWRWNRLEFDATTTCEAGIKKGMGLFDITLAERDDISATMKSDVDAPKCTAHVVEHVAFTLSPGTKAERKVVDNISDASSCKVDALNPIVTLGKGAKATYKNGTISVEASDDADARTLTGTMTVQISVK